MESGETNVERFQYFSKEIPRLNMGKKTVNRTFSKTLGKAMRQPSLKHSVSDFLEQLVPVAPEADIQKTTLVNVTSNLEIAKYI